MNNGRRAIKSTDEPPPVKLGVSACLLGKKVRYDGGHKLDRYLLDVMGPFVDWVPVCPEVEIGLGVPREPMHLVGTAESSRLITRRTGIDYTSRMRIWARVRIRELARENLCGFIFRSRSPSSGMRQVKIYSSDGMKSSMGSGIWAGAFMAANPSLPVEDEERLRDAGIRENFIERVFVYHRWLQLLEERPSTGRLVAFHSDHDSNLPPADRSARQKTANNRRSLPAAGELYATYLPLLVETMKLQATVKKNSDPQRSQGPASE